MRHDLRDLVLYGIDVSPDLISTVTDAVLDEVATWQQRPLDPVYPLVFFDALRVKIRDEGMVRNKPVWSEVERAIHIALEVRAGGGKEVLGLWLEQNEGAKFWLRVMNELRNRGVEDILLAVVCSTAPPAHGNPDSPLTTKLHAAVNAIGLPIRLHPTPGQYGDCPQTEAPVRFTGVGHVIAMPPTTPIRYAPSSPISGPPRRSRQIRAAPSRLPSTGGSTKSATSSNASSTRLS